MEATETTEMRGTGARRSLSEKHGQQVKGMRNETDAAALAAAATLVITIFAAARSPTGTSVRWESSL